MEPQNNKNDRPLPLSMLFMSNAPVLPLLVTIIVNGIDRRIVPRHERFLLWGTEIIKLATLFYALTENPSLATAVIYLTASFVQALTINKIIDPERL